MPIDHHIEEAGLMQSLAQGDRHAFEVIYRQHARSLIRFVRGLVDDSRVGEEIVQEVFTSLWIKRESLSETKSISAWLYSVARRKVAGYYRRSYVHKRFEEHYRLFEAAYESSDPDTSAEDIIALMEKRIAELNPRVQQALRLRINDNLPNKDIAAQMNISVSTVEKHIRKAMDHLRGYSKDLLETLIVIIILLF